MKRIEPRRKTSVRLFEEVGGQPLNWGFTICVIVFICTMNILILIGLRFLLELKDEYDQPILKDYQQEIVLQLTGAFALSFGFGCCCCFCCGGRLPHWILKGIGSCFSCLWKSIANPTKHRTLYNTPISPSTLTNQHRIRPYVISTNNHQNTISTNDHSSGGSSPKLPKSDTASPHTYTLPSNPLETVRSASPVERTNIIGYFDSPQTSRTSSEASTDSIVMELKARNLDVDVEKGETNVQKDQQGGKTSTTGKLHKEMLPNGLNHELIRHLSLPCAAKGVYTV